MNGFRATTRHALGALALAGLAAAGCAPGGRGHDAAVAGADDGLRIAPDPAFAAVELRAVFADPAPDPASVRVEWRRNGATIDGAKTATLDPSRFAKGDLVSVHVFVPAEEGRSAREMTASVRVANSSPRIASVGVAQEAGPSGTELRASVECLDPDRDATRLEYTWFANGRPVPGAGEPVLPASKFARGDRVTLTVVARDDETESPPVTSEPFVLENHPPSFTSRPELPRAGDPAFEYQPAALDPDGDALRYSLDAGPDGMSLDALGRVVWVLPAGPARRGDHVVRLRVADPHGGEAVQEFTIRL